MLEPSLRTGLRIFTDAHRLREDHSARHDDRTRRARVRQCLTEGLARPPRSAGPATGSPRTPACRRPVRGATPLRASSLPEVPERDASGPAEHPVPQVRDADPLGHFGFAELDGGLTELLEVPG